MKKLLGLSLVALTLAACGNNQMAQQPATFGATQASGSVISVKQALTAADDSYVTIEGNIQSQVGKETYLFSDGTAQIRVEIDDEIWAGQNVSSSQRVRLTGEIDKEWNKVELDVKQLTVLEK